MKKKFFSRARGASLLEILISAGLLMVILLGIAQFTEMVPRLANAIRQGGAVEQDRQSLRYAIQSFSADIRSLGVSGTGSYPLAAAASGTIIVYADPDDDGWMERLRYTITSSTLERGLIEPSFDPVIYATSTETVTAVARQLDGAQSRFDYFGQDGADGAPLAEPIDPLTVRAIRIALTASATASGSLRESQTVTPRHFRFQ